MITRIEIDGFKSFLDFKLDVPPLLVLVGPNSSGKSNFLDAVDYDIDTGVLGPPHPLLKSRRGRPHELFHRVAKGRRLREFTIWVHRLARFPEGFLQIDSLSGARQNDGPPAALPSHFSWSTPDDRQLPDTVHDRLWSTVDTAFDEARQSGTARDFRNRITSALWDERTYVPDPQEMRGLASAADLRPLARDGANIAAVLGRMRDTEAFGDLMVDLAALIPDVVEIVPDLNEKRQEWSFDLVIDGQGPVPSTLLSDGTLRVLGLLAALHDPDHPGVLMVEEIENGLHPSRLAELLRRISELVTDLDDPEWLDRPLRQVILTTHSPVVVSELYRMRPDSLVFLDTAVRVDPDHDRVSRVTVAKPVRTEGEPGTYVSPRQVRQYLSAVRQDI